MRDTSKNGSSTVIPLCNSKNIIHILIGVCQGLLHRKKLSAIDHWFKNEKETHWTLVLEKLVSFTAKVPETRWKKVSQSDFFLKKPCNLHFCKKPHQNKLNCSLLKLINVRAHLLYRNQLQESFLTKQRFIYLAKIYCSEGWNMCISVYPCNYSMCPFKCFIYLGTLSGPIAVCQRDVVSWSFKSLCA